MLNKQAILSNQIGQMLLESARLCQEAIARDTQFFSAYLEFAEVSDELYFIGFDRTPERLALAAKALATLTEIRPDAGETHLAYAMHRYRGYKDYAGARAHLALAQKTLPNDARVVSLLGYIDRREGHWNQAVDELLRAIDLDPRDLYIQQELALTFYYQRRFPEMAQGLEHALAILPGHAATRILQAMVPYARLADTRPLHDTLEAMITADPRVAPQLSEYWFRLGRLERDVDAMDKAIAVMAPEGLAVDSARFPRAWCEALVARMRGEISVAHKKFLQAREEVAATIKRQTDFPIMLSVLGLIDANLGRKDLAISEGKKAVELLPLSKDSINGEHAIDYLAIIYAWTGEKDLAIQQLELAASIPSEINYGYLLLEPSWDPLRGDPRFEKILASFTPK